MTPSARIVHGLRVAGLLACISVPSIDMLFRVDDTKLGDEASRHVDLAVTDFASLKTLPGRVQLYLQRRFGFRGALVRAHGHLKVHGLGVSSSHSVLLGKEGWLYLASEHSLDDYRRLAPLTSELLAKHRAALTERKAWLASRGIEYVFFCAPNKHTIYPQFMPDTVRRGRGPSWLDQLIAAAPGLVLDVRPALRAAAEQARVYHRTDTHWNELGGAVATDALTRALMKRHANLQALNLAHLERVQEELPGGDLARMLGLKHDMHEEGWAVRFRSAGEIRDGGKALVIEPVDVQNTERARILNPHAPLGKAVVFRDSFGELLKRPFAQLFRESVFVWTDEFDPALIEQEQPEFVIQELVERRLRTHEPKTLAQARAYAVEQAAASKP
jgi:alginate O-acetyltransferase complex protein AlgJ